MTPLELIYISAVRYALGRMTYIVGVTCDFIAKEIPNLSIECLSIIKRDIEEELARPYGGGMDCDCREWVKLLERLKEIPGV